MSLLNFLQKLELLSRKTDGHFLKKFLQFIKSLGLESISEKIISQREKHIFLGTCCARHLTRNRYRDYCGFPAS